jgi:hypothetical protein
MLLTTVCLLPHFRFSLRDTYTRHLYSSHASQCGRRVRHHVSPRPSVTFTTSLFFFPFSHPFPPSPFFPHPLSSSSTASLHVTLLISQAFPDPPLAAATPNSPSTNRRKAGFERTLSVHSRLLEVSLVSATSYAYQQLFPQSRNASRRRDYSFSLDFPVSTDSRLHPDQEVRHPLPARSLSLEAVLLDSSPRLRSFNIEKRPIPSFFFFPARQFASTTTLYAQRAYARVCLESFVVVTAVLLTGKLEERRGIATVAKPSLPPLSSLLFSMTERGKRRYSSSYYGSSRRKCTSFEVEKREGERIRRLRRRRENKKQ